MGEMQKVTIESERLRALAQRDEDNQSEELTAGAGELQYTLC